jgi:predicted ArsR family transcriptional regulator
MEDRARNDDGTYKPTTKDRKILDVMEPDEPMGTGEIAEQLEMPRRTATYRLDKLADTEHIAKRKLNQTTAVWVLQQDADDTPGEVEE